jgi:tetratricopeptide (TPR) repeat protein
MALGRSDEAIATFGLAIAMDPTNVDAWIGKGFVLENNGYKWDAKIAFETAIQLDPGNIDAWFGKIDLSADPNDLHAAFVALDQELEKDQNSQKLREIWDKKAKLLERLDNSEAALATYDEALAYFPDDTYFLLEKAALSIRMGDANNVEKTLAQLATTHQNNSEVLLSVATMLEQGRRLNDAMQWYSEVLAVDPDNTRALQGYERVSSDIRVKTPLSLIAVLCALLGSICFIRSRSLKQ